MKAYLATMITMPIGLALVYAVVLAVWGDPVVSTFAITGAASVVVVAALFVATSAAYDGSAAALPAASVAALAAVVAASVAALAAVAALAVVLAVLVAAVAAVLAVLVAAVAVYELDAKSGKAIFIAHNIAWAVMIWAAAYAGVTVLGATGLAGAVILPLLLLCNEKRLKQETAVPSQA